MKTRRFEKGFTVVEVMIVIVVLIVLATFFVIQRDGLEKANRDETRKQAAFIRRMAIIHAPLVVNSCPPLTRLCLPIRRALP